nr:tRNA lysidine(34) synthetase TilS [Candidatus Neomarinimicrobiota bacterium]
MKTKWSKLAHKVHQNILLHNLLTKEKKLLIAFSGGRDSVVLLHVLRELAAFWQWELLLGHINHSLRVNEDEKETEFCRNVANNFKIELLEKKINVQKYADENKTSIEKAARKLRYDVFNKWMNNYSIDSLVTGHHQSDQAETIMYRLFTGSGFSGLSGIPYKRGKIIRPILDVTREEINNYIFENELDFMEDSSNSDSNFQRNRIRNKIIPFLCVNGYEQIESNLAKSGSSIASVKIAVNYFIEKEFDNLISVENGVYKFKISEIEKLPNFAIDEILRMIFKKLVNINRHLSQKEILQLRYFILKSETGSIYKIDNDYQFVVN